MSDRRSVKSVVLWALFVVSAVGFIVLVNLQLGFVVYLTGLDSASVQYDDAKYQILLLSAYAEDFSTTDEWSARGDIVGISAFSYDFDFEAERLDVVARDINVWAWAKGAWSPTAVVVPFSDPTTMSVLLHGFAVVNTIIVSSDDSEIYFGRTREDDAFRALKPSDFAQR